jgi:purine catabolism regulator
MITVDELVAVPELGLSYLAGAEGGGRPITWAHTCDQPEPWLWVGAGDLMMTTGGGVPADPAVQVEWLERIAATRACGLMVGPKRGTPELSEQLRRRADELRFPVLDADFELEFASVAHVVIESALRTERARIVTARRLYDAWGQALHGRADLAERLRVVCAALRCQLTVRDQRSGYTVASGGSLGAHREADSRPPRWTAVAPVPGTCPAELTVHSATGPVDEVLTQHLAALLAVELEGQASERTGRRAAGAELFAQLLDDRLPVSAIRSELARRGLTEPLLVACFALPGPDPLPASLPATLAAPLGAEGLHHAAALHRRFPLLLIRDGRLLAVLPAQADLVGALRAELGELATAGLSTPLDATSDFPEAARQAALALAHADGRTAPVIEYQRLPGPLPRSVAESAELMERYLRPLLDHDRANGTELVNTLRRFLDRDGAWQVTATELGIHRQTLVYRLRTVRELTGLHPTSTAGTAKFWLALQAGASIGLLGRTDQVQRNP